MPIIRTFINKIYSLSHYIILGLFVLASIHPTLPSAKLETPLETVLPHIEIPEAKTVLGQLITTENNTPLVDSFFGEKISESSVNTIIEKKKEFITTRPTYNASLKVIQKHEDTIRQTAEKYGVPADVAIGVGLLENGGSETAKSKAGALGVFQLMPSTARNLGLTVNKKVDQRKDPAKNIDAGMRYLSSNYFRFGDWGFATWAYHAGEGNVAKAVQLYFKENYNVALGGLKDIEQMKKYITNSGATIYDVLSSSSVKKFTKKLNDDSSNYPYKVLATAKLFQESKEF